MDIKKQEITENKLIKFIEKRTETIEEKLDILENENKKETSFQVIENLKNKQKEKSIEPKVIKKEKEEEDFREKTLEILNKLKDTGDKFSDSLKKELTEHDKKIQSLNNKKERAKKLHNLSNVLAGDVSVGAVVGKKLHKMVRKTPVYGMGIRQTIGAGMAVNKFTNEVSEKGFLKTLRDRSVDRKFRNEEKLIHSSRNKTDLQSRIQDRTNNKISNSISHLNGDLRNDTTPDENIKQIQQQRKELHKSELNSFTDHIGKQKTNTKTSGFMSPSSMSVMATVPQVLDKSISISKGLPPIDVKQNNNISKQITKLIDNNDVKALLKYNKESSKAIKSMASSLKYISDNLVDEQDTSINTQRSKLYSTKKSDPKLAKEEEEIKDPLDLGLLGDLLPDFDRRKRGGRYGAGGRYGRGGINPSKRNKRLNDKRQRRIDRLRNKSLSGRIGGLFKGNEPEIDFDERREKREQRREREEQRKYREEQAKGTRNYSDCNQNNKSKKSTFSERKEQRRQSFAQRSVNSNNIDVNDLESNKRKNLNDRINSRTENSTNVNDHNSRTSKRNVKKGNKLSNLSNVLSNTVCCCDNSSSLDFPDRDNKRKSKKQRRNQRRGLDRNKGVNDFDNDKSRKNNQNIDRDGKKSQDKPKGTPDNKPKVTPDNSKLKSIIPDSTKTDLVKKGAEKGVEKGGIKALAQGAKAIPILGTALAVGMTVLDAKDGWDNAGDITGNKNNSTSQKLGAAGANVLSGLSFGLIDAKDIYGAGASLFGSDEFPDPISLVPSTALGNPFQEDFYLRKIFRAYKEKFDNASTEADRKKVADYLNVVNKLIKQTLTLPIAQKWLEQQVNKQPSLKKATIDAKKKFAMGFAERSSEPYKSIIIKIISDKTFLKSKDKTGSIFSFGITKQDGVPLSQLDNYKPVAQPTESKESKGFFDNLFGGASHQTERKYSGSASGGASGGDSGGSSIGNTFSNISNSLAESSLGKSILGAAAGVTSAFNSITGGNDVKKYIGKGFNKLGGDHYSGIAPDFRRRFELMAADYYMQTGRSIQITDGYRSIAEQADLKRRKPKLAATPGKSLHNFGWAMDINPNHANELDKMKLLSKYGFHRPLIASKKEYWHLETQGVNRKSLQKDPKMAQVMKQAESVGAKAAAGLPYKEEAKKVEQVAKSSAGSFGGGTSKPNDGETKQDTSNTNKDVKKEKDKNKKGNSKTNTTAQPVNTTVQPVNTTAQPVDAKKYEFVRDGVGFSKEQARDFAIVYGSTPDSADAKKYIEQLRKTQSVEQVKNENVDVIKKTDTPMANNVGSDAKSMAQSTVASNTQNQPPQQQAGNINVINNSNGDVGKKGLSIGDVGKGNITNPAFLYSFANK